jgi:hypothetical protein
LAEKKSEKGIGKKNECDSKLNANLSLIERDIRDKRHRY